MMTAKIWLQDSAGAWLSDVTDDAGAPMAETAYCLGLRGPVGAKVRIEGEIKQGLSLVMLKRISGQ